MKHFPLSLMQAGDAPINETGKTRRRYRKPSLESLGDLRTITLGGSPGVGDSGASSTIQSPILFDMPGQDLPPLPEDNNYYPPL